MDDAELLSLGKQWAEVHAERMADQDALTAAEHRYYATCPKIAPALIRTTADAVMHLCWPEHIGKEFDQEKIDAWRGKPQRRYVRYPVTEELRQEQGYPEGTYAIERPEPWPEKQARVEEIIQIWDQYQADRKRARIESGLEAEEARDDALRERLDELEHRIALMPAVSMAGLLLKAAAYSHVQEDGQTPDLNRTLAEAIKCDADRNEICALSIVRDLYNIGALV
jgi:hypothetical protein